MARTGQIPTVKTNSAIFQLFGGGGMMLNATFNNISVLSWWSVFWWRKSEYPEKTTNLPQVTNKFNTVSSTSAWVGFELTTLVVMGTDCICGYKSNYHTITNTTVPHLFWPFWHCMVNTMYEYRSCFGGCNQSLRLHHYVDWVYYKISFKELN